MMQLMLNETTVYQMLNGLTIIYTQKDNDPFISISYGFKVGSVNEDDKTRGMAHFIEHMTFNGSKNYSKDDFNRLPKKWSGSNNANTCKNVTRYDLSILKEYAKEGIHLLNDLVFYPTFPEEYMNKEKGIVIQELKQYEDNDWSVVFDLRATLFNKSNLQYPIVGFEKTVNSFTRQQVVDFHNKYYIPSNCIVSICGDISIGELINYIESIMPKDTSTLKIENNENITVESNKITKSKVGITQSKILKSFVISNKYYLQFDMISKILGEGLDSRLVDELREKQSLAYQVGSEIDRLDKNNSLFTMYISYEDINKTAHILNEMSRIINELSEDLSDDELELAKASYKGDIYKDNEKSESVAYSKVRGYVFDNVLNCEDVIKIISEIKKEDLIKLLKDYYDDSKTITAILQPETI